MGNTPSLPNINTLLISRTLSPNIEIGIRSGCGYSIQTLRFQGVCYDFVGYQIFKDRLLYQFADQVFLEIGRGHMNIINYTLKTSSETHIGQISDTIVKTFRPMNMNSKELDTIHFLFADNVS